MADYIHSNNHYINNEEFLAAIIEYRKAFLSSEKKPKVPDFIADCLMKISTHLSYKPNFNGYSFRDEMVLDGIENCLMKVEKFDPEKSNNPFWYFTQICYRAFVRRILDERKQTYIKGKIISQLPVDMYALEQQDTDHNFSSEFLELMQLHGAYNGIVEREETRLAKKKAKAQTKKTNLEEIFILSEAPNNE